MAKIKHITLSKNKIEGLLFSCKTISESLEDPKVIIRQFNLLTPKQRFEILTEHIQRETNLKADLLPYNDENMYLTCTMVNLNIIATKYNIDPATVCMCICSPCKNHERILIK